MNEKLAKAVAAALDASSDLKASEIKVVALRESYDIETNQNKVRVEVTFNVR